MNTWLLHRTAQAAGTVILLALCSCAPPRSSRIIIGAKNFTEQVVLGELLAQEIEAVYAAEGHPNQRVARRFYLACSYICQQALVSGRIDAYVEYTGTALTAILKQPLPPPGQRAPAPSALQNVPNDVSITPTRNFIVFSGTRASGALIATPASGTTTTAPG